LDSSFTVIGEVDARVWSHTDLNQVSERPMNDRREPYVSITGAEWEALCERGRKVIAASDAGQPPKKADLERLLFAAANRWEVAVMIGWGFLDGSHPSQTNLDVINRAAMLSLPGGVYAYQIEAETLNPADGSIQSIPSVAFIVDTAPMPALSSPVVTLSGSPLCESRLVHRIDVGPSPSSPYFYSEDPMETAYCQSQYRFETDNVFNECLFTRPMASDSALTGEKFDPQPEIGSSWRNELLEVRGKTLCRTRAFDFKIPFYDCEVWLEVAVGDHWDRYLTCPPTTPAAPKLDYKGLAPMLGSATCDGKARSATLDILKGSRWTADRLARVSGRIEFLARRPDVTIFDLRAKAGPPFLTADDNWGALITPPPTEAQQEMLALHCENQRICSNSRRSYLRS
jgi:hypothetical protein